MQFKERAWSNFHVILTYTYIDKKFTSQAELFEQKSESILGSRATLICVQGAKVNLKHGEIFKNYALKVWLGPPNFLWAV